jgi:hypothetical protein
VAVNKIEIKDILIPLFSAFCAVGVNQLFFFSNLKSQAKIELKKERIKVQTPILNRILSFTYKHELISTNHITTRIQPVSVRHTFYNTDTKITDTSNFKEELILNDTSKIDYPAFIIDSNRRNKLYLDLNEILKNRDLLDHSIYIKFDEIVSLLEDNSFPILDYKNGIMSNSNWDKDEIRKLWFDKLIEIRGLSLYKLNELEN